jgi:Zn-dependent protease
MAIRFSYDTGTFEIGRYRGAPIELSPLFFLSAMALALPFWRSFDLRGLALTVMFLAIFFASILIHELAHAAVATRCRVRVARIELNVLGGLVHFWGLPRTMRQDFLITAAGPLSNLVLGLAALALLWPMPPIELSVDVVDGRFIKHLPGMLPEILRAAAYLNLGLCAVNLLPGIPLDGGKLLYLLVERRFNARTALLTVSSLGVVFAVMTGLLFIGTLLAGCPVWAPPMLRANWEAFQTARRGRSNWDAVAFRG